jgi:hypothetical protein
MPGLDDDRRFEERFRAVAIPSEEWTHEAQLRMAFLLLRRHEFHDAVRRIRRGIRRLNRANGVVDSEAEGYHETRTLAWARVVAAELADLAPEDDFAAFIARNPALLDPDRILLHYSQERIGSVRARREFVLPDRSPLPLPATPRTIRNRSTRRKDSAAASADTPRRPTGHQRSRRTRS